MKRILLLALLMLVMPFTRAQSTKQIDYKNVSEIREQIKSNTVCMTNAKDASKAKASFLIRLFPDGEIMSVDKVKSSGVPEYDKALEAGILKSSPLPKKGDGTVERSFVIDFAIPNCAKETVNTVDKFIDTLVSTSAQRCASGQGRITREFRGQKRLLEAYQLEQAEKMLCECVPTRAKKLQSSLPVNERTASIVEETFSKKYLPEIIGQCVVEQLKSTFAGECSERYANRVPDAAQFCSCMAGVTDRLSVSEAVRLGDESSNYASLASAASKPGAATPIPPPLLKSFMDAQKACSNP